MKGNELVLTIRAVYGKRPALAERSIQNGESDIPTEKEVFARRRLTTSHDSNGDDYAFFVPGQGLVGHPMWHTDYGKNTFIHEERAVLMQSLETYLELAQSDMVGKYFARYDGPTKEQSIELILTDPGFGEQLIVEGCVASQLCIGDVFAIRDGSSQLKLQVTSSRFPCSSVDQKFGSPFGVKGVRRYTLDEAATGWFCRVLHEGHVTDGMQLVRIEQPHPEWNLRRASRALYVNKADRIKYMACMASWSEPVETLREFVALEELGNEEWGEVARGLLNEMEQCADAKAVEDSETWCMNPFGEQSAMFSLGACACLSPVIFGIMFDWNGIY